VSLWPGYRLGRYRVESEIARGGQATVYRAVDEQTGEAIALKVIAGDLSGDATLRARLQQEAAAVRALDHPGIVAVREAGEIDGTVFISMTLVDGPSLQEEIQAGGGLDPLRAVALLRQLAEALDHAHAHGMVHRDVKPANVLIGPGDRAYLTDFGLAKVAKSARLTRTGMWVGTVEYIAPEQLMAQGVGPPADVYGLSALAYETLAGRPPFVRQNPADLIQAHLTEAPRPPSSLRPSLAFVDGVLARGLAKAPEDRYESAGAMVRALAESLGA
jgi:serine/threonine protein kinase